MFSNKYHKFPFQQDFKRISQSNSILFMADPLQKVRQLMQQRQWTLYLLPRTDEHQSEYIAQSDERVHFISGFSGSNAIALISLTEALLWTDGRYFLQAEKELQKGWQLKKMMQGQKMWFQHIIANYPQAKLGVDPRLLTAGNGAKRIEVLVKNGIKVDLSIENLVDLVWTDRPKPQKSQIYIHEQWAGKSIKEKVQWVRQKINEHEGNEAIFNELSEIAWLLNLRSDEIPFNPFFKGVLIIKKEGGSLYLPHDNPSLKSQLIREHLGKVGLNVQPYQPVFGDRALITKADLNYYIFNAIKIKNPIEWQGIGLYRAVRDEKQIQGFKRCHIVDGVAMAKFWAWRSKLDEIDQFQAAQHLNKLRYQQELNKGLSFETISGGGSNAAIIHYHPTETNHSLIKKDMIHLVDSGGQYLDGTTDVTRTFHFGNPTPQEKDAFTRVLLGNLDVQRLRWPSKGTINGGDIDVLARRHLWEKGLDYNHGTGHGVGYFQGVHEGPVGISKYNQVGFKRGMIVTNEPGYYEEGKFGIRIENQLLVEQKDGFNWFYNLTLCPYDKQLLDHSLLSVKDIDFINTYHQRIWNELSPRLAGDQSTLQWLKNATSPLK